MKKLTLLIAIGFVVALSINPPFVGSSQEVAVLMDKQVDTSKAFVSQENAALIDSFNRIDERLSKKLDTLNYLAKAVPADKAKEVLKKYFVTSYEAPLSVMKLEFSDKYLLIQYDSINKYFNLKEIILK
ncbi:MAG TPA: hypothetical protein VK666_20190 [Chryseolinea sp.]|nr:hypothetical protein [Chryseolinea sp.]